MKNINVCKVTKYKHYRVSSIYSIDDEVKLGAEILKKHMPVKS